MAALVVCGAGYIGGHMVLALQDARHEEIVVLDDLSTGFDWAVPEGAKLVVGDVTDQAPVTEMLLQYSIDDITHFAARIIEPDVVAGMLSYYFANTAKTRTLIDSTARTEVRHIIFSSTAAAYGKPKVVPAPRLYRSIRANPTAAPS